MYIIYMYTHCSTWLLSNVNWSLEAWPWTDWPISSEAEIPRRLRSGALDVLIFDPIIIFTSQFQVLRNACRKPCCRHLGILVAVHVSNHPFQIMLEGFSHGKPPHISLRKPPSSPSPKAASESPHYNTSTVPDIASDLRSCCRARRHSSAHHPWMVG